MKFSKQRELILQTVKTHNTHLTVDEIYTYVKKDIPTISLATVYRNVKQLVELNEIRQIPLTQGGDRYDGILHEHFHVRCVRCGTIFDVDSSIISGIDDKIVQTLGFLVEDHQFFAQGACKKCREKVN